MRRTGYVFGIVGLVLIFTYLGYVRLSPTSVSAAPNQQGIGQLPLDLYILLNQPGPLWLAGIDLEGVDLGDAKLTGVNLRQARLARADLSRANLVGASLVRTNFVNANLSSALLQGADLANAYLQNADLRGADLSLANLDNANLNGAKYDVRTVWPVGFDPISANAKLVEDAPTPTPTPE